MPAIVFTQVADKELAGSIVPILIGRILGPVGQLDVGVEPEIPCPQHARVPVYLFSQQGESLVEP
jgi:hypothetical protein